MAGEAEAERGGIGPVGHDSAERGHRTLAEKAFVRLHAAILTGGLAPGARLPIEELGRQLGMSPMPIREALRRLDALGLVENVPHRGATVARLSAADLADAVEARLALELPAIRRAAERFTLADERRARRQLERLHAIADERSPAVSAAHEAFHFALYQASGSPWLMRLLRPVWESCERYARQHPECLRLHERRPEHERIVEACVAHDPAEAASALRAHVVTTTERLMDRLGGRAGSGRRS